MGGKRRAHDGKQPVCVFVHVSYLLGWLRRVRRHVIMDKTNCFLLVKWMLTFELVLWIQRDFIKHPVSESCSCIMATVPFSCCCCCWPDFSSVPDVEVSAVLQIFRNDKYKSAFFSCPKNFPPKRQLWLSSEKCLAQGISTNRCLESQNVGIWTIKPPRNLRVYCQLVSGCIDSAVFLTFSFCVCVCGSEWSRL